MSKKVQVIINPAAGNDEPILNTLNNAFQECEVDWDVSITHRAGDGRRLAQRALQDGADVVAAYGGDGTVAEVASGLVGSEVPLAILPGGTANVMSLELGIPNTLLQAARLACGIGSKVDRIDVGQIGSQHFLLRVAIGFEAAMVEQADRGLKDRFGVLAYLWSAMKNLLEPTIADYQFVLDGKEVECRGFTCAIANSGNLGLPGLQLSSAISVRDGLLDVITVEEANLRALSEVMGRVFGVQNSTASAQGEALERYSDEIQGVLRHWQAREISVSMTPMQATQYDGELLESVQLPIQCKVMPQLLKVIVPDIGDKQPNGV